MATNSSVELKIDWCSHAAAKFACQHYHYSKKIPAGKRVMLGVWEAKVFIGCVIFSTGACPQIHRPFQLDRTAVAELTRVALREHFWPVTRILRIALLKVSQLCPGLRLIISYADPEQSHVGAIYQGANWLYLGKTSLCEHFVMSRTGKRVHSKSLKTGKRGYATSLLAAGEIQQVKTWKYKYVWPIDKTLIPALKEMAQPYPKQASEA